MVKLIVDEKTGYGKVKNENGDEFIVMRAEDMWNFGVRRKGAFMAWVKENVKRFSTIQRFVERSALYDVEVVMKQDEITEQDIDTIVKVFESLLEYCDWDDGKVSRIIGEKETRERMREVYIKASNIKEGRA